MTSEFSIADFRLPISDWGVSAFELPVKITHPPSLGAMADREAQGNILIRPVVGLKQRGVVPGAHIPRDARRANNVGPSFAPHEIFMTAGGTRVARMGRKGAV